MPHDLAQLKIPREVGVVWETYNKGDSPLSVILLKEAVGDPVAQKNTAKILKILKETFDLSMVYIDTVSGPVKFPKDPINPLIASLLQETGRISGVEYVALSDELSLTFYGVDDAGKHKDEVEFFEIVRKESQNCAWVIDNLRKSMQALSDRFYSPELRTFEQKIAAFHAGSFSLEQLLYLLDEHFQEKHIQWDDYPTLQLMIGAKELPPVDNALVQKEAAELVKSLHAIFASDQQFYYEHIHPATIIMLEQSGHPFHEAVEQANVLPMQQKIPLYLKFKKQAAYLLSVSAQLLQQGKIDHEKFFDIVVDLSTFCNIAPEKYPNLIKGSQALHHKNAIESKRSDVVKEINQVERRLREALSKTEDEKYVTRLSYHLKETELLLQLQALPDEWKGEDIDASYLTLKGLLQDMLIRDIFSNDELERLERVQPDFDDIIKKARAYYRTARLRCNAIVENMVTHMTANGINIAVLFVTGYLESRILSKLKNDNISYASINTTISTDYTGNTYLNTLESGLQGLEPGARGIPSTMSIAQLEDARDYVIIQSLDEAAKKEDWQKVVEIGVRYCVDPSSLIIPDLRFFNPINHPIKNPNPIILFYLAVAYLRLEQFDASEHFATEAIKHCKPEHQNVKNQLTMLLEQLENARAYSMMQSSMQDINDAIQMMNEGKWGQAVIELHQIITKHPNNAYALYYHSYCSQQLMIKMINSQESLDRKACEGWVAICDNILDQLDKASNHCPSFEDNLKKQIWHLRDAVDNIRRQLHGW